MEGEGRPPEGRPSRGGRGLPPASRNRRRGGGGQQHGQGGQGGQKQQDRGGGEKKGTSITKVSDRWASGSKTGRKKGRHRPWLPACLLPHATVLPHV